MVAIIRSADRPTEFFRKLSVVHPEILNAHAGAGRRGIVDMKGAVQARIDLSTASGPRHLTGPGRCSQREGLASEIKSIFRDFDFVVYRTEGLTLRADDGPVLGGREFLDRDADLVRFAAPVLVQRHLPSMMGVVRRTDLSPVLGVPQPLADVVVRLLYTSPSPRDRTRARMPSSA